VGGGGGLHSLLKITVLQISGGKVTLGFDVDADIPVYRQEIWERICAKGEVVDRGVGPPKPHVRPD
jgi:sRNA-binding carbon storage regulator CsrA